MTILVTVRHDNPDVPKRLLLKKFEVDVDGRHILIQQVWIDPGHQEQFYIWNNRYFLVEESDA